MPGSVKALRLHNLILGGGLTAAQLETELNNARAAGAFNASLKQRTVVAALKSSPEALSILAGSTKAVSAICRQDTSILVRVIVDSTAFATMVGATMAVVIASANAMAAIAVDAAAMGVIAGSATFMAAVAASSMAITACMGNTVARLEIYNSDTALSALTNPTAVGYLRAVSQYATKNIANGSSISPVSLVLGGIAILVDIALNSTGTITFTGQRAGSTVGTLGPVDPVAAVLPGHTNIMALQSTATVATSTTSMRTTAIGYICV